MSRDQPKRRVVRYSPDLVPLIRRYAEQGMIDEQITEAIGIHRSTLYDWRKKYPEVAEALRSGKEIVDAQVESALLRRALGYEYDELHVIDGPEGRTTKRIAKQVAPDVTAQIFWLKNRMPKEWRDRQSLEHTGKDGGPIEFSSPRDEIERRLARIAEHKATAADPE